MRLKENRSLRSEIERVYQRYSDLRVMRIDVDGLKGSAKESFASALSSLSQQNAFFETFKSNYATFQEQIASLQQTIRDQERNRAAAPAPSNNDDRLQMELLATQLRLGKQEHEFALLQAKNDVLEEERTRLLALHEQSQKCLEQSNEQLRRENEALRSQLEGVKEENLHLLGTLDSRHMGCAAKTDESLEDQCIRLTKERDDLSIYLSHVLQDLEDKTPLLLEQKQAYETLKRNYHTLLLQWNQFCEQTLASSEGSFIDSTKLLYAEVLRLREEVGSAQRQVELLRSQRDALRSKFEVKESVKVSDVKVSDVKVSDVKEVRKEKEEEKEEEEKKEKEKVEKEEEEKEKEEKEEMEKACELAQLRESAKRLERRLQAAEARRKRAEARSQSLQSQLARCERALAEIGLNSDTTRLSRMSALAMELRSHFDETATVLLRSLVDGNARIQGYLERGLESVAQLQTKLTVPETPAPLLEVNEEGEEKPLSEAISALVEQNADLEETMREMEGDEDEMNRDLEAKAARITALEAEVKALAAEKAKMVEEVAKVARLVKKEEKSDGRVDVCVKEAEGVVQRECAKEAEALRRGQQEVVAAWEAERAVLTRWAEEAKVLVKECEASRVAGLVNSLRVLSLTLCAESGACAEEEMEEEKMEEVEKEEKVCLEESNSALRTALEKAERVTHELEDRVTGLEAAARRSQGAWEAKEKEAKRLALEVESVRRLNDELKMENEGLKRCGGEVSVSVNGVSEEKEETEKEGVEEENGVNEEKASEEEKEVGKESVNEEENAMTEEKEMEEEKASEVEKEEMKVEKEEEEKEEEEKEEKMEEVVVEEKAEEETAKEATEEKESTVEGENMVNEEKENKKEMEEEQKEKEEAAMKGENTVNEEKEEKEKEEEQNEKEQKKENKETANEEATTLETENNHPPTAETEKLSKKRAAEENPNPPSKKPYALTLSTLKLRIRYAFEKWNPKWMRRMKAVSDKLDKMTKTPEEGFKEMCTIYKWDEAKIQEMEKIQSQSDYDAMVQEWKKD
ncbi:dynein heavy chain [Blastocystis sp. ATCC 50177/Nand II]|uniref:Dynein heavy chain n=1 Tax=Blastocystis sp. subtype 1 (strain ATCC 50177 / NandII) TaxID=478820 RepID=A0A196SFQ0_BLAHN|nr:dynein heavy chain [Blastocystis sp. ATCC 50177/Nand II]